MIEAKLIHKDKKVENDPMLFACLDFYGDADVVKKLIELKELIEGAPFVSTGAEIDCLKIKKNRNLEEIKNLQNKIDEKIEKIGRLPLREYEELKRLKSDLNILKFKNTKFDFDIDVQKKLSYATSLEKGDMYRDMIKRLGFKLSSQEKFGNTDCENYICDREFTNLILDIDALYTMTKQEQLANVNEIYAKHRFLEEKEM